MFRQILVHEDDRNYQLMLWRYDPLGPVFIYAIYGLVFGFIPSPYQANRCIKQLAKDHKIEHLFGAEVLRKEIYVDDVLSGGHTLTEALLKQIDTRELLALGCFPLRKWLSNHLDVLIGISEDSLAVDPKSFSDSSLDISVLGLSLHPVEDVFYFNLKEPDLSLNPKKRIVLSKIAKLFDPLGWLAPIIMWAKCLMQPLWQEKRGWDDSIHAKV